MIKLRQYKNDDLSEVSGLFYETVHAVNKDDYTESQLCAWASSPDSLTVRRGDLLKQYTLVAESGGKTVGFGSISDSGYLDLLFVHKDYQRQGIATVLCDELEKGFAAVETHASVTARPFFEKRGYMVVAFQEVERSGIKLKNYQMVKKST